MRYEDIADCGRGMLVRFRDGRQGRLTHWYAGTGMAGVTLSEDTRPRHTTPSDQLPIVDIDPERFEVVESVLVEQY